jgi:integrase
MPKKPMDPATRLRRQFRERAKDPMAHLMNRKGVYCYARRIPAPVRAVEPTLPEAVRRSTGTERLREAQAIVREWAAVDEEAWLGIVSGNGSDAAQWLSSLRSDRDRTLDRAQDVIEARADALGVRSDLERAKGPREFPEALKADPKARPAIRAVYAARGQAMTWSEAWDAFETRSGLSVKTRLTYGNSCAQFDRAGLPGPHEVTREKAREYLRKRAAEVTRSTVNIDMAAATAILTHLFDGDEPRTRLFRDHKLRFAKAATVRGPLTRDDLKAMLATGLVTPALGLLMRLSLATGARRNEAYHGEYDLDRKVLVIGRAITKTASGVREVPLADRVVPIAARWLALRQAKALPRIQALQASFAAARAAAGLPSTKTLHSCRHAFLTALARAGVAEDRRKTLGGHSKSGNVHAGYVHLDAEDLRQDAELVDFETGMAWPS